MKAVIFRLTLVIVLIVLVGCKIPGINEQKSETSPVPTGNASSSVPTKKVSSPVPTPLSYIPDKGEELCESSFSATVKTGSVTSPIRTVVKKAYDKNIWDFDPNVMVVPHLEPMEPASVQTLLCIKEDRTQSITYPDGRIGYKLSWETRLVLYPSGDTVGSSSFEGDPPPDSKQFDLMKDIVTDKEWYGDPPAGSLLDWLFPFFKETAIYTNKVPVHLLVLSPQGNIVAVGGSSNIVTMWNYQTGDIAGKIPLAENVIYVQAFAYSPDGKILALPGDPAHFNEPIQLWDIANNHLARTFSTEEFLDVSSMAFSPDGALIATGNWDGAIYLWDVGSGKIIKSLKMHTDMVNSIAFSPDGKTLVSGGYDGAVFLWDVSTGKNIYSLEGHTDSVDGVAFSPDGSMIASGSQDNSIILWDSSTGQQLTKIAADDHVSCIAFSPDGKILAYADPIDIKLWNIEKKGVDATLGGHSKAVSTIVFTLDGKKLISGSGDTTVRVWDLQK